MLHVFFPLHYVFYFVCSPAWRAALWIFNGTYLLEAEDETEKWWCYGFMKRRGEGVSTKCLTPTWWSSFHAGFFKGELFHSFPGLSFWFWTPIEQLKTTDWTVKSADLQKTVTRALSLPSIFCILSVSVTHSAVLTTPLLTQNKHSWDTDKMLLTAHASHSSTQ